MRPPARSLFDALATRYDAWFESKEGLLIFQSELAAIRAVSANAPRPWLEIGVGSGRFAAALGIDVGIDPAERLLEMARRRGVYAITGYGERLPFENSSFGAVFLIVTLCFVGDPLPVLRESRRVLRPGGELIVGLVPREGPWGARYSQQGRQGHPFYSHAQFYTVPELKGLLAATGFTSDACFSTLLQPPGGVEKEESPHPGCHHGAGFIALRSFA